MDDICPSRKLFYTLEECIYITNRMKELFNLQTIV